VAQKINKTKVKAYRPPANAEINQKKPWIDPRYKSFVNTIIFILVLLIFFIVNNTRKEPESGPYPPYYNTDKIEIPKL
jgi:hypothetical protein